jgi:hypothetical protein
MNHQETHPNHTEITADEHSFLTKTVFRCKLGNSFSIHAINVSQISGPCKARGLGRHQFLSHAASALEHLPQQAFPWNQTEAMEAHKAMPLLFLQL